jgi:hypothetical protein
MYFQKLPFDSCCMAASSPMLRMETYVLEDRQFATPADHALLLSQPARF